MLGYPVGETLPHHLHKIKQLAELINSKGYTDLGIVCTGSSGAIIATAVACYLQETPKIYYIKKKYERNHGHGISMAKYRSTLIFVDDFISSGATVQHVIKQLKLKLIPQIQAIYVFDKYNLDQYYVREFFKEQFYI